jgi:hypothetical protein
MVADDLLQRAVKAICGSHTLRLERRGCIVRGAGAMQNLFLAMMISGVVALGFVGAALTFQ